MLVYETIANVSRRAKVSHRAVRSWARTGKLAIAAKTSRGTSLFLLKDVQRFIAAYRRIKPLPKKSARA